MIDAKNEIVKIDGIVNGLRISTQQLLQEIYRKIDEGYTNFEILASGQHDIGGPIWSKNGKQLTFRVKNPGQRLGSMGMKGTRIIVDGPVPADVGWLNSGAEIIIKGDGGDTSAHCAASGKLYVAGRVGTRSGALMKHDPKFDAPEVWILKNTGSFSFEFMGGGVAVVCGHECDDLDSVIGHRSCVGMVGGTVYIKGNVSDLSEDVWLMELDDSDIEFLLQGLRIFLNNVDKPELYESLSDMTKWQKIVAKTFDERKVKNPVINLRDFRLTKWVEGGIFGDLIEEDYYVSEFVERANYRLRTPEWKNANYSAPCEYNCPAYIPTQKRIGLLRQGKNEEALKLVLDYSPFPASVCGQVCPNLCIDDCSRKYIDIPVKTKELGLLSRHINIEKPTQELNKKIAILGSGAAGLTVAWNLRRKGYQVDIFEEDKIIGGKLRQVIPAYRLDRETLESEIQRILDIGVNIKTETRVDKELFKKLEQQYSALVLSGGAHMPVILPIEGNNKLVKGLDFLKAVNNDEKVKVGKKVVVIGAGNAAMDVVIGAYQLGAEEVTVIDIQKPAAFENEIKHAEKLGAKILWPCFTEKITAKGVHLKDGRIFEADTVIISVGDRPDLSYLEKEYLDDKNKIVLNDFMQLESNPKIFVAGDVIQLGLFTHAIGDGRKVAVNIDRMLSGLPLDDFKRAPVIPQDRIKKEFYNSINPQKVSKMEAEQETDRCMSCGTCRDCGFCKDICPEQAITREEAIDGSFEYVSNPSKCIGCGVCAGVCPCGIWTMEDNLIKYEEA